MKENSIEEDLKKLGKIIEKCNKCKLNECIQCEYCCNDVKSINNILSDYKRVLKENEIKTEKIENQKNELAILNDKQKDFNKLQNDLDIANTKIIELLKENEELKGLIAHKNEYTKKLEEDLFENSSNYVIQIQKVKDKITEIQKEYNKLDEQIDEYLNNDIKDPSKYYENKERVSTLQTLSWIIDNLQELMEVKKDEDKNVL